MAWFRPSFEAWRSRARYRLLLWRLIVVLFIFWLLSLIAFFYILSRTQHSIEPDFQPEMIVVLGSSTPNAHPSPTLIERLKLCNVLATDFPAAKIVVSGGVDFRQTISEAQVMRDYLVGLGLSPSRIIIEDESTSTYENLLFSAKKVKTLAFHQDLNTLIVTSDFHTLRAKQIAAKVGWSSVKSAGAVTPFYMRYNAWLREYFAYLSGWIFDEF